MRGKHPEGDCRFATGSSCTLGPDCSAGCEIVRQGGSVATCAHDHANSRLEHEQRRAGPLQRPTRRARSTSFRLASELSGGRLRVQIRRGAAEIGGSCVELEANGERVVLDVGRPLWAGADEPVPLPSIPGLAQGRDPSLLGVVLSHGHLDHYGLLEQVKPAVPLYAGPPPVGRPLRLMPAFMRAPRTWGTRAH
jgi:glyoxylase-like metal-dependent hydrolase (beta-lactamase superfamily II)